MPNEHNPIPPTLPGLASSLRAMANSGATLSISGLLSLADVLDYISQHTIDACDECRTIYPEGAMSAQDGAHQSWCSLNPENEVAR